MKTVPPPSPPSPCCNKYQHKHLISVLCSFFLVFAARPRVGVGHFFPTFIEDQTPDLRCGSRGDAELKRWHFRGVAESGISKSQRDLAAVQDLGEG